MTWTDANRLWLLLVVTLLSVGCSEETAETEDLPWTPSADAVVLNNRGVALMGQFDYAGAFEAFQALTVANGDWLLARTNLSISVLNRQQPGDDQLALTQLDEILQRQPGHLDAHYLKGIVQFNLGDTESALENFQTVADADSLDAYAAYFTGQTLLQMGRLDEALVRFQTAMDNDSYLRSAYYGAFLVQQRLRQPEIARDLLEHYQRLDGNPRSRLAEIKYTRMGPRAMARPYQGESPPSLISTRSGALFGERLALSVLDEPVVSFASATIWRDGDGVFRLLIHHDGRNSVIDLANGSRVDANQFPFLESTGVTASAWGDIDNDGRLDLYLTRDGNNELWLNQESGWVEQAEAQGVDDPARGVDVLMIDADHDGDLDLLLANDTGPVELFNNNGNGTFRRLARDNGMAEHGDDIRQVLAGDLDNDRDLDLLTLAADGSVSLYRNDRLWRYARESLPAPGGPPLVALALGDLNVDGEIDLIGVTRDGRRLHFQSETRQWVVRPDPIPELGDLLGLRLVDFDGDGQPQWLIWGTDSWLLDGQAPQPGRFAAVMNADPAAGPSLIDLKSGTPGVHPPGPGRHGFLGLAFSGAEDPGQSMRSNYAAVGTRFVIRSGIHWTAGSQLRSGSGPGQDAQPLTVGMAGHERIDFIEIDWPDGVFQTELELAGGQWHRIVETQRQLASCPVIFAWDGTRHRFISDMLGVAGLGFAVGPDQYATPRAWENFHLPEGVLQRKDGAFEILITEPMEEIAYLDRVRLVAIDSPSELFLTLDERMATADPEPEGDAIWYRRLLQPIQARDRDGTDHLQALLERDLLAVPPGRPDRRFLGLLEQESVLEFEFREDLSTLKSPVLLMHGWVEYGYSQTSFAAWQAGISYQSPTLEALDATGRWVEIRGGFGYPAGMPREAALPLPRFGPGIRRLRLRTNQEIYWDQLALVDRIETDSMATRRIAPESARVRRVGFPTRQDGPQRKPGYNFDRRAPFWDTRYPRGRYTAYGEAVELVNEADNALAIIGPGDAMILRFKADLQPLRAGWTRHWVLELDGWAKDMDLYTRNGETVGPLPKSDHEIDRSRELHSLYNTRFQSGR